mmetsp:Transcript_2689/g.10690  ORF Transcript_2689/g.10690 Transcript_2689/m.10690 type:complete len:299 (-) Transcript_2689:93-989(-)
MRIFSTNFDGRRNRAIALYFALLLSARASLPRATRSLHLGEVVRHLRGGEHPELPVLGDDADLDIFGADLAVESLLEGEDRGVDGILQLHVLRIALLQERLGVGHVFPDRARLPREVRPGGVHLVQLRAVGVEPRHEKRRPEGTHAASLRELLHHRRHLAHELRARHELVVRAVVHLRLLARFPSQHAEIRTHAAVRHADLTRELSDLLHRGLIHQGGRQLLLRRQHHAVFRADAERRRASLHSRERVLDLHELAAGVEGGQRVVRARVRHRSHSAGLNPDLSAPICDDRASARLRGR